MPIPKQKPLFLLVLISFESCVLVENLLRTALFILTFDFSLLRQLIKTGRFLHRSFFFQRSLIELSAMGISFNLRFHAGSYRPQEALVLGPVIFIVLNVRFSFLCNQGIITVSKHKKCKNMKTQAKPFFRKNEYNSIKSIYN